METLNKRRRTLSKLCTALTVRQKYVKLERKLLERDHRLSKRTVSESLTQKKAVPLVTPSCTHIHQAKIQLCFTNRAELYNYVQMSVVILNQTASGLMKRAEKAKARKTIPPMMVTTEKENRKYNLRLNILVYYL